MFRYDDDYMFVPKELMKYIIEEDKCNLEDFLNSKAANRIVEEETKNEELKNEITELKSRIKKLENFNIENLFGYTISQDVYVIKTYLENTDCDKCNHGYINIKIFGKPAKVICPFCNSDGYTTVYCYAPIKTKIGKLEFKTTGEYIYYSIFVGQDPHRKKLNEIYRTEKDCQIACDKLNKKKENTI